MNYIIFEDKSSTLLSPFTDLHATFELRTGIFTNIDRILSQLSNDDSIQLYVRKEIEDIIREKYPNSNVNPDVFNPGVYINGTTICFFDEFKNLDQNLSYCNSNKLVTFRQNQNINKDDIDNLINNQSVISSKTDIISFISNVSVLDASGVGFIKPQFSHPSGYNQELLFLY